ncbi:MAG: hypothetical protein LC754_16000 [Acidobacteria bacterium]|nr:hypothetical protein [Acidobacteriota bacterium]
MNLKIKLFAFSISVITLAACSTGTGGGGGVVSSPGGNSSGSNGAAGNSAAVISADDKPLDVMTRAMRAQLDAKSYRAHITSSTDNGTNSTMVVEYVAPDRYRMTREGQAGGKAYNMEYVITGDGMFLKAPNGQWVKSPIDASEMIKAFRDPKMLEELAKTGDVKFIGADVLDGMPMLVYQYTQTNPLGMKMKSTAKTWLAVTDGLPRKTETDGEFEGMKTKTLVTISDYNSDIRIESPIK